MQREGAVAVATIDRPEAMNALDVETLGELRDRLTELRKDQADYIGVKQEGPYKSDHYRY